MQYSSQNQVQSPAGYMTLHELCSMLSISPATGRNWIRLGKLKPQISSDKNIWFSLSYVHSLQRKLMEKDNAVLKSRRNKKYISGRNIYSSYVSEDSSAQSQVQAVLTAIEDYGLEPGRLELPCLLAECALQLLCSGRQDIPSPSLLKSWLEGCLLEMDYDFLIEDLIEDRDASLSFVLSYPDLFNIRFPYEAREDILGLLYISTSNLGKRKATGSYYTPTNIVKKLCSVLFCQGRTKGSKILDPSCGTGNFLLQLPDGIPFEDIYGNDIDELSVKIARINMALKYSVTNRDLLYTHIRNEDYLDHHFPFRFDYILGNPPWGYEFESGEKDRLRQKYHTAQGKHMESYDIFLEQALRDLRPGGSLSFILPQALLHVKSHRAIRTILTGSCAFEYLAYLGDVFDQIQCPSIILQMKYTGNFASCLGMVVEETNRRFTINRERSVSADDFSFLVTDEEYHILEKIRTGSNICFLAGQADFALGIVTGNNKEFVTSEKTDSKERILKGSDLGRYHFRPGASFIEYTPEAFQQVAPEKYYRAPEKLLYRFICNQLVFAYDDQQTLSLNSCNILIPRIEGLAVKYVLAILNSRTAQYYFRKSFHSLKVLKSHIEQIPIPDITEKEQEPFLHYVERILAEKKQKNIQMIYDELDEKISRLYGLDAGEYAMIKSSMKGESLFL